MRLNHNRFQILGKSKGALRKLAFASIGLLMLGGLACNSESDCPREVMYSPGAAQIRNLVEQDVGSKATKLRDALAAPSDLEVSINVQIMVEDGNVIFKSARARCSDFSCNVDITEDLSPNLSGVEMPASERCSLLLSMSLPRDI